MPKREDPSYYSVEDYRGSPFSTGASIPYPEGSSLYQALAIFRDCNEPITRHRFESLGGRSENLDQLLAEGNRGL